MIAAVQTIPRAKSLDPSEFCRLYSKHPEGEWGHKGEWKKLLAYVLDVSGKTIDTWGTNYEKCPEKYRKRLAEIHVLKIAEQTLRQHGLDQEYLDNL